MIRRRVTSASHIVTVKLKYDTDDTGRSKLEAASEINNLLGDINYRSQSTGSEWDKYISYA